ncbi:hypothetical protein NPIL_20421 [Nephila pilipes]|uniref:Uncharacterized protein n=1 Tax=Nephila pilipes TaxID=299642 RepID=A0A8X6TT76_NEPPI|nr:hypothetical protein NPIL_20421 [Nephila pilipes]
MGEASPVPGSGISMFRVPESLTNLTYWYYVSRAPNCLDCLHLVVGAYMSQMNIPLHRAQNFSLNGYRAPLQIPRSLLHYRVMYQIMPDTKDVQILNYAP